MVLEMGRRKQKRVPKELLPPSFSQHFDDTDDYGIRRSNVIVSQNDAVKRWTLNTNSTSLCQIHLTNQVGPNNDTYKPDVPPLAAVQDLISSSHVADKVLESIQDKRYHVFRW